MYKQQVFNFKNSTEYEFYWEGYTGQKKERAEKRKATPEQIMYQNRRNKITKLRRTIKKNFEAGDLFVTLTYAPGEKKTIEEAQADFKALCNRLRKTYKKSGDPFKWIRVIEVGKRGSVHIHLITNRTLRSADLINKYWVHGHPNFKYLYEEGDYQLLSEYMTKAEYDQEGNLLPTDKSRYNYSTSRNLVRPEPDEVKRYAHWTMARIIRNGLKAKPGYYIDKASVKMGINKVTGKSYLYYTERKIDGRDDLHSPGETWTIEEKWRDLYHSRGSDE